MAYYFPHRGSWYSRGRQKESTVWYLSPTKGFSSDNLNFRSVLPCLFLTMFWISSYLGNAKWCHESARSNHLNTWPSLNKAQCYEQLSMQKCEQLTWQIVMEWISSHTSLLWFVAHIKAHLYLQWKSKSRCRTFADCFHNDIVAWRQHHQCGPCPQLDPRLVLVILHSNSCCQ